MLGLKKKKTSLGAETLISRGICSFRSEYPKEDILHLCSKNENFLKSIMSGKKVLCL